MRNLPTPSGSHFLPNGSTNPLVRSLGHSPMTARSSVTTVTAFESTTTSHPRYYFPSIPVVSGTFDFASLTLILCLLILSSLSLFFVIHLRLKSRRLPHLQNFNSLWTVRLLLVFFASFWAVNEVLRLPFLHQTHDFPFLPPLTLAQQTSLCKVHVVLSLGFFEPGFLVTLLFLVNVSIKKRNPSRMWALAAVVLACTPILFLQTIFVFFTQLVGRRVPKVFTHGSSVITTDALGDKAVLCTYPTFSCLIFGAFAVAYALAFLFSCWKVVAFVINKTIGGRINMLALSVMVALPVQILCLGLSPVTLPGNRVHDCAVFAMFLSVSWCVAVGEVILVIKPISDALAAGGDYFRAETRRWDGGG